MSAHASMGWSSVSTFKSLSPGNMGTGAAVPPGKLELMQSFCWALALNWSPLWPRGVCGLWGPSPCSPAWPHVYLLHVQTQVIVQELHKSNHDDCGRRDGVVVDERWKEAGGLASVCCVQGCVLGNELIQIPWRVSKEELWWSVAEWIRLKFPSINTQLLRSLWHYFRHWAGQHKCVGHLKKWKRKALYVKKYGRTVSSISPLKNLLLSILLLGLVQRKAGKLSVHVMDHTQTVQLR